MENFHLDGTIKFMMSDLNISYKNVGKIYENNKFLNKLLL